MKNSEAELNIFTRGGQGVLRGGGAVGNVQIKKTTLDLNIQDGNHYSF